MNTFLTAGNPEEWMNTFLPAGNQEKNLKRKKKLRERLRMMIGMRKLSILTTETDIDTRL